MPSPVLFVIACLIWGSTFWAITLQLGDVPPAASVVYRFALASAVLFAWCKLRGDRLRLPWRAQCWTIAQGCATFGLSYICTYTSEQYLVSALVAVLFALMVFWNPILNRLVLGTPLSWRTWAAGSVAVVGVILLFSQSIGHAVREILAGGEGHFLLGLVTALVATVASSAGNVMVVKVREQSSNVLLTMAWGMLWGALLVALWTIVSGQRFVLPTAPRYWAGLLYLAFFGSVIAFACYFTLIDRIGSGKAVYIGVVTPVISVLLSIRLENFRPGVIECVGMLLCLSSVAWALAGPARPAPAPRALEPELDLLKKAS
ncbi:drug/metabolite transporter (DMT)-like permease [Pseudoduganella flava]|uniref:Drug/metabolite transporter (DMT)-like permease n=1 Tax=Pseudoduganella flava TaxID=871742 RepID=A0A562PWA8_9BURK|nr:EamA family transporter [Pseudoduganella flava]QGZ39782.1 EamA family transporter [Pseudoduganella flava]TWI48699.1 drug/metabolite transporter (DMT)-like permease [Pseudoduganella flava]